MMMLNAQIRLNDFNEELTDSIPSSEMTGSFKWKTNFRRESLRGFPRILYMLMLKQI